MLEKMGVFFFSVMFVKTHGSFPILDTEDSEFLSLGLW